MSDVPSQWERVVKYMADFGSITRAEAMAEIGVANLPAVIDVIRHQKGIAVNTIEVAAKNRYGQDITYARYELIKEEKK